MSKLKLTIDEETGEVEEIDESVWPKLGEKFESVLDGTYVSVKTVLDVRPKRGRSAEDISASLSITQTVLAKVLLGRLEDNPTPSIIITMEKCLDLDNIFVDGDSP